VSASTSQPVERVVTLLSGAGYECLPQPVEVAAIPFEFSAVLAARSSLDLVVVVDTVVDRGVESIRRRVEGLSRALDLVESRRPLTIVLIGPEPVPELQVALTRIARVLVVGVPSDERELREAVAVLLPLDLVTVAEMPESWPSAREKLLAAHPYAAELLQAAALGSEEVAEAARRRLLGAELGGIESP
jgi:hypothetical protein